jgi:hypothetical protein
MTTKGTFSATSEVEDPGPAKTPTLAQTDGTQKATALKSAPPTRKRDHPPPTGSL